MYYVEYDGIGLVKIDATVGNVPQVVASLYDNIEQTKEYDELKE